MDIKNKPSEIKAGLLYFLLLSYIEPQSIDQLRPLRETFGYRTDQILEDVCQRIVTFHQARRYPDDTLVKMLKNAAGNVVSSVEGARDFQQMMEKIAAMPARSREKNRLHSKRACQFCSAPCRYGYFSLLLKPDLARLEELLKNEAEKPAGWRKAVPPVWQFTLEQVKTCLPANHAWEILPEHLGGLAYCLLALATSKSRFPFPAAEMSQFQSKNQAEIKSRSQDLS